jgi:hypothetical protein
MASRKPIDMSKQQCNYCRGVGHRIHTMDAFGVYINDQAGNRVLACPVLIAREAKEEELWPELSGNVQSRSAARELVRNQRVKEEKQRQRIAWKERQENKNALVKQRQENKNALVKASEEAHVQAMMEKYGKFWYRKLDEKEECSTASNIRANEDYEEYCIEGRLLYELRQRESVINAKWEKEDKEREERRATMTEKEKRKEEKEWEDAIEVGYQREQDALDYWRQTGVWWQ